MLGPHDSSNAHFVWLVQSVDSNFVQHAGQTSRAGGEDLSSDAVLRGFRGRAIEPWFSLDGPVEARPFTGDHSSTGLRVHLGPAKDDYHAFSGCPTTVESDYDVVDDGVDDRILFPSISQWALTLLDRFKYYRCGNTILCNRVGTAVPSVSQGRAGTGSVATSQGNPAPGDGRRCKND